MRILVGMPSPDSWGGPIACEPPFVGALRAAGHDVRALVYVYGDKDRPTPFLSRIFRVVTVAFRLRKAARRASFDIIHLNSAFDGKTILRDSASLFIVGQTKAKVFIKLHGSMAESFTDANFITKSLIDYLRRRVDGFGYLSDAELEGFVKLGFDRGRFFKVKNVVPVREQNAPRNIKERDEVFELLFVSRFAPAKGLVETIEACGELRKRGVTFRLTCVGDGEARRDADDAVGRLGLGRVVTFTGYIPEEEVARYYQQSDVFIFPTTHPEGFPLVLFKAVSAGLPIVTTRIRAAADYLSEPENCLFTEKDPIKIADRIMELIDNKQVRIEMSKHNIELGRTFSADVIAAEYVEIYKLLLGEN